MSNWKSYHLLAASFSDLPTEPAPLFRWSVERVVDGLVDHSTYVEAVERKAMHPRVLAHVEARMPSLVCIDANPIAELMLTPPSHAAFQARWNGYNRRAPLGVETTLSTTGEPSRFRRAHVATAHEDLQAQASSLCVGLLLPGASGPRRSEDACRLATQFGALGYRHSALEDCVDHLYEDPAATLDACAARTGCARRTLQRTLTHAGLNFRTLRQAVRLTIAGHAIRTGNGSLTFIAQAAGFFDSAHFVRAWKLSTGLTPSQYQLLATFA
jgi:AraC-like DNA-binding protein